MDSYSKSMHAVGSLYTHGKGASYLAGNHRARAALLQTVLLAQATAVQEERPLQPSVRIALAHVPQALPRATGTDACRVPDSGKLRRHSRPWACTTGNRPTSSNPIRTHVTAFIAHTPIVSDPPPTTRAPSHPPARRPPGAVPPGPSPSSCALPGRPPAHSSPPRHRQCCR